MIFKVSEFNSENHFEKGIKTISKLPFFYLLGLLKETPNFLFQNLDSNKKSINNNNA